MKTLPTLLLSFVCFFAFAQKSDSTRTYYRIIRGGMIEHATELKSKRYVKNGISEIKNGRNIVATGSYKDGERLGAWKFFNGVDSVEQIYNYTTKKLEYNLPFRSIYGEIDSLKKGDRYNNPAKIGGFYTGLYFLLKRFTPSKEFQKYPGKHTVRLIFYIDEKDTLTKYIAETGEGEIKRVEIMDLEKLHEDDFKFVPAFVNGKAVTSRLIYKNILTVD